MILAKLEHDLDIYNKIEDELIRDLKQIQQSKIKLVEKFMREDKK